MNLIIFTDGGAKGNPGPAAVGVVIQDENGKFVHQFGKFIGHNTNNFAEYMGVVEALKCLKVQGSRFKVRGQRIDFYIDSLLVVNQLNGIFKIKNAKLRELVLKIRNLEQQVKAEIHYHYIPREKNLAHDMAEKELI